MRTLATALLAIIFLARLMPAMEAHAGDGLLMEDTERWRVYRNPRGQYERKYKQSPAQAPKAETTAPVGELVPATSPVAERFSQTQSLTQDSLPRVALGAFYNPISETVIPMLSLRLAGSLHIAGGASTEGDKETTEVMYYLQSDILTDNLGVFAGVSYIQQKNNITPGCAEIDVEGDGGTAFGGLTFTIGRMQLLAGLSIGQMEMEGSSDSCGYDETAFEDLYKVSGTVGLLYYIW